MITYKGISYLVFFLDKLNQLLLKLGFIIKIIILIKPNFNNNIFNFYIFLININKNKIPLYVIKLLF